MMKILNENLKALCSLRNVDNHHHIEVILNDRLGNIQNVHAVVRQIRAHLGDDANLVLAQYGNDSFQ
ncbi:hypothetical protein D3C71_1914180 [compost metagenome]